MPENKREIEMRGQDVAAAIEAGLTQLGVSRNDVIVEVIDEGSRGLLGIGSRDAVVRLTSMFVPTSDPKTEPKPEIIARSPRQEAKARVTAPAREREDRRQVDVTDSEYDSEQEKEVALELVQTLLDKMQVTATLAYRLSEPDDLTGRQVHIIDIQGEDLGVLIGPRGETLNAIQYIARLMVGHQLRQRASFVVDVQGYRQRREQSLVALAKRHAKKVTAQRRPYSLEPMPPHERRIIHITLRDDETVYTQSVGEGKRRKVRIIPK